MNLILVVGIIIVVGFFGGLASAKLKFPMITGYIIIGVLLSPSLLNIIPRETVGELDIITNVALGIIAYLIGGSLHWADLQKLAKRITWIVPFESLGSWFLVTLVLASMGSLIIPNETFWQTYFPLAFIIGAVSCATAPAATMAIVSEYRAKGPFTTTLLAVVGLDDAIAVIAFAIASGISQPLVNSAGSISFYHMLDTPFLHIVESISIGIVFAIVLMYMIRLARTRELLLVVVFGMIMLCTGVSTCLGLSSILANMVAGFIIVNMVKRREIFIVIEEIENVVYVMFFVLAGLHFDLSVMKFAGILALLIVLARCLGKYTGARVGARISHAPDNVKKYLGLALLPKAGVTVGLVLLASIQFPTFGVLMLNAVLASTIINELIAPPLTKYAIFKSGEAEVDQL
ncbi:MAG: cation:proton antiporter [Euryarchaeota archaeon]|nr:cation:proton antiporter [Euryarchaeota archaeon]